MIKNKTRKRISIVVPVYNEKRNILPLHKELIKVWRELEDKYNYEIIFVDDGSKDGGSALLQQLALKDSRIKVLSFTRNFGKESALSAGCRFAVGEAVITMDADLQHPPELIPKLITEWEQGFEMIYTIRKENKGASFTKKITSRIYWWIFTKIASTEIEPHSTDFRLMDRKVVEVLNEFSEKNRLFRGIIDWMGFKKTKLEFIAPARVNEMPGYSYPKLIVLALNSFTSFSLFPLKLAGYLGVLIVVISSGLLVAMFFIRWFINATLFTAMAFFMVGNTFLIGLVLICLGFIALYIARINDEVVNRPLYIVRNKINLKNERKKSEI